MKRIFTLLPVYFLLLVPNLYAQKWDTLAPIPESFTFPVVAELGGKIHIKVRLPDQDLGLARYEILNFMGQSVRRVAI